MLVGDHAKDAESVCQQRQSVYGSPEVMQEQLAAHWTALLRAHYQDSHPDLPPIPPHLVGLMMACLKLHRCAVPYDKKDADSYVDLHNYIDFSENIDPSLPQNRPPLTDL